MLFSKTASRFTTSSGLFSFVVWLPLILGIWPLALPFMGASNVVDVREERFLLFVACREARWSSDEFLGRLRGLGREAAL